MQSSQQPYKAVMGISVVQIRRQSWGGDYSANSPTANKWQSQVWNQINLTHKQVMVSLCHTDKPWA